MRRRLVEEEEGCVTVSLILQLSHLATMIKLKSSSSDSVCLTPPSPKEDGTKSLLGTNGKVVRMGDGKEIIYIDEGDGDVGKGLASNTTDATCPLVHVDLTTSQSVSSRPPPPLPKPARSTTSSLRIKTKK